MEGADVEGNMFFKMRVGTARLREGASTLEATWRYKLYPNEE